MCTNFIKLSLQSVHPSNYLTVLAEKGTVPVDRLCTLSTLLTGNSTGKTAISHSNLVKVKEGFSKVVHVAVANNVTLANSKFYGKG